jgi:mannan endo-1,4-beta-mannosidase
LRALLASLAALVLAAIAAKVSTSPANPPPVTSVNPTTDQAGLPVPVDPSLAASDFSPSTPPISPSILRTPTATSSVTFPAPGAPIARSTVTPPSAGSSGGRTTTPRTSTSASCRATYAFDSVWGGGFVATIRLTNISGAAWSGWTGGFSMAQSASVQNSWGATMHASQGWVALTPADYNASVTAGTTITIGFQANTTATVNRLGPFVVNGRTCLTS